MDTLPELSVRHLRCIVALSRAGKFTAAAAELGLSQPGLSRIVQQAEQLLGVRLFDRVTRSVAQTEAGRSFIPAAERMLGELEQQVRHIRALDGDVRGQLIVSSLMSISHHVLPAALLQFRQRYPRMHIRIREGLQNAVQEDVRSGVADFGIGGPPSPRQSIIVGPVTEERCHAILPPGHPLAGRRSLTMGDLAGECFVSMPAEAGLRRLIDATAAAAGVSLDHGIVINQYQSLFDFVSSGLGVAIVPASALPPERRPDLTIRPMHPAIRRKVAVLHHEDRPLSAVSQEFLAIFQPMFLVAIGTSAGKLIASSPA